MNFGIVARSENKSRGVHQPYRHTPALFPSSKKFSAPKEFAPYIELRNLVAAEEYLPRSHTDYRLPKKVLLNLPRIQFFVSS